MGDWHTNSSTVNTKKKPKIKIPKGTSVGVTTKIQHASNGSDDAVMSDKIRIVLNQLTADTFNTSIHKLKSLSVNTEDRLNILVRVIVEKAVNDTKKAELYAKVCVHLTTLQVRSCGDECVSFKKLLVKHCQQELEVILSKEDDYRQQWFEKMDAIGFWSPASRSGSSLSDNGVLKKMGIVIFLGNLFKSDILTLNTMRKVIKKLFSVIDEDVCYCLCSLLLLVGHDMEAKKQDLSMCLTKVQEVIDKKGLSKRVKEQLERVIECKRNRWKQVVIPHYGCIYTFNWDMDMTALSLNEDSEDFDWAMGTLSHVALPRRVMKNQMRQAKIRCNQNY